MRARCSASGRTAGASAAVVAGTLAGFLLRPNPLGALRLVWIQLGLYVEVKRRGLPLPFGLELQPLSPTLEVPRLVLPGLACWRRSLLRASPAPPV